MIEFTPSTIGAPVTLKHQRLKRWVAEIAQHREWFEKLGNRLPTQFALKRELLALRLTLSEAAH